MRNVREVVEAAAGKPILFFPARHDHWLVQTGDGWAAHVAGAIGVSTDAQASWWGGTRRRHRAARADRRLRRRHGGGGAGVRRAATRAEMNVTVLVDFDNDSVRHRGRGGRRARATTSGACASTPPRGWSTARSGPSMGDFAPTGVNRALVARGARRARRRRPRARADRGLGRLRRRADPRVRGQDAPVDAYGVGLVAAARPERLHRRRGARGRTRWPRSGAGTGRTRGWTP